ncbi:3'-end-processing protein yth1 [Alternaria alternata]|nr:3'-end-processing protein yth1 [Alternaria alternata]
MTEVMNSAPTPAPEPKPVGSQQPQYTFKFSEFLRREYRFGLSPDRPVCKAYLQGHCPDGNRCPNKHNVSSSYNKYVNLVVKHTPPLKLTRLSLVCKHWLRGLCKKGETCEFLHEYNLRRMPECSYYARTQTCSNGDDCLYLHIDPEAKRPSCPHYDRGFCPLGPYCALKHNKKEKLCPFYLCGFCPEGKNCKYGAHPRFPADLKKPEVRVEKSPEELEAERIEREREMMRREEEDRERDERNGHQGGRGFRGNWDRKKRGRGRGRGGRGRGDY